MEQTIRKSRGEVDRRVVLVTGASSGIGRSCAEYLAGRGLRVFGASRSVPEGSGAGSVTSLAMDVRDEGSVARAVAILLERAGRIDAVVNNAGFGLAGALEETSAEEVGEQMDVNVLGVLRVTRAVLPTMRRQGSGHVINIGSIGGLLAVPFQGMYSASKFALEGMMECLRMEVRPFGIRVVLIEPGDHRTSFTENRRLAEASSGNTVYRTRMERAIGRMSADEQGGPDPERIARLVGRVIGTANPRLRYTIGPGSQRAAVMLKRLMPYAVVERILRSYYGI